MEWRILSNEILNIQRKYVSIPLKLNDITYGYAKLYTPRGIADTTTRVTYHLSYKKTHHNIIEITKR